MATAVTDAQRAVARVVACGPRLSLQEVIWQLEAAGLKALTGDEPGPGYRIEPAADWTFPPAEIRRCRAIADRSVVIEANVLALLGPEAPLPDYWLESAARQDASAQCVRRLLAMLNAPVYEALASGWRDLYGAASAAAWARTLVALSSTPGGGLDSLDACLGRRPNRFGVQRLVQRAVGSHPVEVADGQPVAHCLEQRPLGGGREPRLGDGWGLGGVAVVAGGQVDVRVGPMPPAPAGGLIDPARVRRLGSWLRRYLGPVTRVRMEVVAASGAVPAWHLGTEARLGVGSWLGPRVARQTVLPVSLAAAAGGEPSAQGEAG